MRSPPCFIECNFLRNPISWKNIPSHRHIAKQRHKVTRNASPPDKDDASNQSIIKPNDSNNTPPPPNNNFSWLMDEFNRFPRNNSLLISTIALACGASLSQTAIHLIKIAHLPPSSLLTDSVSIIIPTFNEERCIKDTIEYLQNLRPKPLEIIVVDGGSTDKTLSIVKKSGVKILKCKKKGRGRQMNAGAGIARGKILMFVHADSQPPVDAVLHARQTLALDSCIVLGGFFTLIENPEKNNRVLLFPTFHNFISSYYAPAIFSPIAFLKGMKCMFGDQSLFCRAGDFKRVGMYNGELPIMEDADLCMRLHVQGAGDGRPGREIQLLHAVNRTSGRRIHALGNFKSTVLQFYLGLRWWLGASTDDLWRDCNLYYSDAFR